MKFTAKEVADYYNTTQVHYKKWWNLEDTLSLRYGIWEKGIKSFGQSLINTNSCDAFSGKLTIHGFKAVKTYDYTEKIQKSAKRMYYSSLLGFLPSEVYNLLHPNVSRFAKTHYKCGYYQYKALRQNLWRYKIITARK